MDARILDKQVLHGEITQEQREQLEHISDAGESEGAIKRAAALFKWEQSVSTSKD